MKTTPHFSFSLFSRNYGKKYKIEQFPLKKKTHLGCVFLGGYPGISAANPAIAYIEFKLQYFAIQQIF